MKILRILFISLVIMLVGNISLKAQCGNWDYVIYSQAMIDDFEKDNPGCINLPKDLVIYITNVNNLKGLKKIKSIKGGLRIDSNNQLKSLEGLDSLTSVSYISLRMNRLVKDFKGLENLKSLGGLALEYDSSLVSLEGLEAINSLPGGLYLYDNPALEDLKGLDNVTKLGELTVSYNKKLKNFEGLDAVKSISSTLTITHNDSLLNLHGLGSLDSIGFYTTDTFYNGITVQFNPLLNTLDGMYSLSGVKGVYTIADLISLKTMGDYPKLKHLGGLNFYNDTILTDISGLSELDTISKGLSFFIVRNLKTLDGLENLKYIKGGLYMHDAPKLKDISALSKLTAVNGELTIKGLLELKSLKPLENIDYNSIYKLTIEDNIKLSNCSVKNFCDYYNNKLYLLLSGNAYGCQNFEQVIQKCSADTNGIIQLSYIQTAPSCHDKCDGIIQLSVMDGLPPYSYEWSNGNTTFKNIKLCKGLYLVTITDALDHIIVETINLAGPDSLELDVFQSGGQDQPIVTQASVKGGTPPFKYKWSDGATNSFRTDLKAGEGYSVSVTDAKGCKEETSKQGKQGTVKGKFGFTNKLEVRDLVISPYNLENSTATLRIINVMGQVLWQGEVGEENYSMDTRNWSRGIYYIQMRAEEGVVQKSVFIE